MKLCFVALKQRINASSNPLQQAGSSHRANTGDCIKGQPERQTLIRISHVRNE